MWSLWAAVGVLVLPLTTAFPRPALTAATTALPLAGKPLFLHEPPVQPPVPSEEAVKHRGVTESTLKLQVFPEPLLEHQAIPEQAVKPGVVPEPAVKSGVVPVPAVKPGVVGGADVRPQVVAGVAVVAPGQVVVSGSTTTLDPLTAYCQEACKAGVGGPECNCPDHPIG